jgi:AGCS family alanine or glycine:cation symporter
MRLKQKLHFIIATCFFYLTSTNNGYSQHVTDSSPDYQLDQKINEVFEPISQAIESVVLYSISLAGAQIPLIVIILALGGIFFTLYFRFPNITRLGLAVKITQGKYDDMEALDDTPSSIQENNDITSTSPDTIMDKHFGEVSHFQALSTAVSGTVGLGNIAGVTMAISLGGPGATFWMIVSGFLGMTLKFVECTLGVQYRDIGPDGTVYGGPMYYLSKGLKEKGFANLGKILSILFAILCIGGAFGIGNAAQSNQVAAQVIGSFNLQGGSSGFIIGTVMAILVGITIIGGIKRIATVTEYLVPFMAILYIVSCLVILGIHYQYLGEVFNQILTQAFRPEAGLGGIIGVLAIGFRRASFSNEAGSGSASIAHSAVKTKYAASEGIVALLEPFIDTVVICTMTALVIIIFNINGTFTYGNTEVLINGNTYQGATLTSLAFQSTIWWFPYLLTIAIILFALSTMISWSYYGQQAWLFLFGRKKSVELTYKFLFLVFIIIGAASQMSAVWNFADSMILAMIFPNMVGLIILFPVVKKQLTRYEKAIKKSVE